MQLHGQRVVNRHAPGISFVSSDKGVGLSHMSDEEIDSLQNPAEGTLVYSTDGGCVKRYDASKQKWPCIIGGNPIPSVDTHTRHELEGPTPGDLIYDKDEKCMAVYKAEGGWQCTNRLATRQSAAGVTAGLPAKKLYPIGVEVTADGYIHTPAGDSATSNEYLTIRKLGTGEYEVTFKGLQKLQSVTANILDLEGAAGTNWDPLDGVSIYKKSDKTFIYYTGDSGGNPGDRPIVFIAFVSGRWLPPRAHRLHIITGVVDGNITQIASGRGFSVSWLSTGLYNVSLQDGVRVLAMTAQTAEYGDFKNTSGIVVRHFDGLQYKTGNGNGGVANRWALLTAVVEYPADSTMPEDDGRYAIGGIINADGSNALDGVESQRNANGKYTLTFPGATKVLSVNIVPYGKRRNLKDGILVRAFPLSGQVVNTLKYDAGRDNDFDMPVMFSAIVK